MRLVSLNFVFWKNNLVKYICLYRNLEYCDIFTKYEFREMRKVYNNFEEIECPHLKEKVKFNAKGFGHLIYKNGTRRRSEKDIMKRFESLQSAYEILQMTTTIQKEEIKENTLLYGYIAIINDMKLKVIIKKISNGSWFFYSVIPHFITSPKRDSKNTR